MSKFKENWLKVDEHCSACGSVTKQAKGLNKQNLMRLVKPRWPTYVEWIVIIFIFIFLLNSLAYRHDTEICREFVKRDIAYWKNISLDNREIYLMPNISNDSWSGLKIDIN